MKKKRPAPQNDISGIILANQWDGNGNVIGVSIYTDREEIYIVARNQKMQELISLVQTRVSVEGKIKQGADGKVKFHAETVRKLEKENER